MKTLPPKEANPGFSLMHHPDFLKLWAAQTTSQLGGQIAVFAVPLTAALVLKATPFEMGILSAAGTAPHVLFSLFAGIWADRHQRRLILIAADVGRAALLMFIPIAYISHVLRIKMLFLVVFSIGVLTLFFDVTHQSYLPTLVRREQLTDGNAKLLATQSAALLMGPGLAGVLVSLITAPGAITITSATFALSAALLMWIKKPELSLFSARRPVLSEIREGLRIVIGNPLLRAVAGYQATSNLFVYMVLALIVLYCTTTLNIGPRLLGLIFAGSSLGFLFGALAARRISDRIGPGPSIVGGATLMCIGYLLLPLVSGVPLRAAAILVMALALSGFGETVFLANQMSLRQAVTPNRLQGRMNATMRFLTWSSRPIGALLGGLLGDAVGIWMALVIGSIGTLLALPWVYASPLLTVRKTPASDEPENACCG